MLEMIALSLQSPTIGYDASQDLRQWLVEQFGLFGGAFRTHIFGTEVYVLSEPRFAQHVLRKNWQNYKKGLAIKRIGLLLGSGLMVSEGEFWKTQRRMIQPAFDHKAVAALAGTIGRANIGLRDRWIGAARQQERVNVTRDISTMVLGVVLVAIFGADVAEVAPHFAMLSEEPARDLQFAQAFRSLGQHVTRIVARRRQANVRSADLLGLLMDAHDHKSGQVMSDRQLVWEIVTLIVAGHETTASTLNWVWYLLAQHPEIDARLAEELHGLPEGDIPEFDQLPRFPFTRQVIEEALRLYPPGWLMTRKALNDDNIDGYVIPAGAEVYISPYLIQRHPDLWDAPDEFRPDRFAPDLVKARQELAMLPFSAGPRNCIGEFLARVEMQMHVMLVARTLRFRSEPGPPLELEAGVNLRSKHDFVMTPQLRQRATDRRIG